jgi:hypothetical protein
MTRSEEKMHLPAVIILNAVFALFTFGGTWLFEKLLFVATVASWLQLPTKLVKVGAFFILTLFWLVFLVLMARKANCELAGKHEVSTAKKSAPKNESVRKPLEGLILIMVALGVFVCVTVPITVVALRYFGTLQRYGLYVLGVFVVFTVVYNIAFRLIKRHVERHLNLEQPDASTREP